MNLNFVSFQGIHADKRAWGMVQIMEPISDEIGVHHHYYVSRAPKNHKYFVEISPIHKILERLFWALGIRLNIHVGLLRYLQEISFDFFSSRLLKYPCILVSTAYIPSAAQKNMSAGGINVFVAGNPYDSLINSILERENNKYKIKNQSAYTFKPRLKFIDRFLSFQNEIIFQTAVTYNSYRNSVHSSKKTLIPFELIPNSNFFKDINIEKRECITFIYLASSVWLKGLTYLIEAWNSLDNLNARLIIVGSIYPDVLESIQNNLTSSIELMGFVPGSTINSLYRSCHVCIVPSLADNHPSTIAEAMYCGLPVIATSECGSCRLIVDGGTGFIVPSADSSVLAEKIRWFLQNPGLIKPMGQAARATIDAIDKQAQVSAMAHCIRNNLDRIGSLK